MKTIRMFHLNYLAEELVNLTMLEAKELVRILEVEHGIVHVNPYKESLLHIEAPEPEPTEFDVLMVNPGNSKLMAVKTVKTITGLGLKDSKDIVDNAPIIVMRGVTKQEAEDIKEELMDAGAEVRIV